MKKLAILAMLAFLGFFTLGCGGPKIDTSGADTPKTSEEVTTDIEQQTKGMTADQYNNPGGGDTSAPN